MTTEQQYIASLDIEASYNLAKQMEDYRTNPVLGYRPAGSKAEFETGEMLKSYMEDLGLSNVRKDEIKVDGWEFEKAVLAYADAAGERQEVQLGAYQTDFVTKGAETFQVVYVGKGGEKDYADKDVAGKIVLAEINQRDEWWINFPVYQAHEKGAKALIAVQVGGYGQVDEKALNAQDIAGPPEAAAFSMSFEDSEKLKACLDEKGEITVTLDASSRVMRDVSTYNILGEIPGKCSDRMILLSAHYDSYFSGFQDDNTAVALMFGIAKSLLESGYQPNNTIVFCAMAAEEWGVIDSDFDWSAGAYEQIFTAHPEWVGKTLAFINFELPAYEFDTYTTTYSAPEMFAMLDYFANDYAYSPEPEGCFADGVLTEGYQTYTYSDDFSYYAAGVPSTVNGFLLQKDMETVFPFYIDYYHTQYDTPDTYNEAVMRFNIAYYGALAMYIDQMPAADLDFTAQTARLTAAMDKDVMAQAGADVEAYQAALAELDEAATAMRAKVVEVNRAYEAAREAGDEAAMAQLRETGRTLTSRNLEAFRYAQKHLLGLMYERPIVPHEAPQETITLCEAIIDCLKDGDPATAVDEYAWTVNNVLEWYAMYFSPEVITVQDDMNWGADNQDNLYWGTDINFDKADVDAATRSLYVRYDDKGGDFTEEIAIYEKAIETEKAKLAAKVQAEAEAMAGLAELLK